MEGIIQEGLQAEIVKGAVEAFAVDSSFLKDAVAAQVFGAIAAIPVALNTHLRVIQPFTAAWRSNQKRLGWAKAVEPTRFAFLVVR